MTLVDAAAPRLHAGPIASHRARAPSVLIVVSVVVGLVFASPIAYIAWRNLTLGTDLVEILLSSDTWLPLWRSAVLALSVSVTTAAVGTGLAWLVVRTDLPAARLWRIVVPLPLVYPSFVGAAALITAFAPGGLAEELLSPLGIDRLPTFEGFSGSWLVLVLFTYPFVYLPVAARLRALPSSLEESARLLGRSGPDTFGTVVLPQAAGAISAGALLVFLYTVSDFGVVQLMDYGTLTREIYIHRTFDLPVAFALALVLGLFAIAVVVLERQVSRRLTSPPPRSGRPLVVGLGRLRWPAFALVAAFIANALVAPAMALAWWAWRGISNAPEPGARLADDLSDLVAPAGNTAVVSVVAALVAVLVLLPVAYLTTRYRSRPGGVANAFVVGGFAIPGLAVALAMVFWSLNAPVIDQLYQTIPLLIFAYVVHFGAQSMRASQVAVASLPERLEDAARMLGAGRVRRFVTIEVPIMLPGLLAGAGLVLLSTMKELPATLLLSPPGFETLATRIWASLDGGFRAEVGVASLVLVLVSGLLTWLLVVRRADAFD